jgi:hypothetical protein
MFGLCPIQKNGAIQKDLVADIEWSPYKCRCDIFVAWAPFKGLLLTWYIGDLPKNNHFITLQIDGQAPNLFYSNYITRTEKSVVSNDITN